MPQQPPSGSPRPWTKADAKQVRRIATGPLLGAVVPRQGVAGAAEPARAMPLGAYSAVRARIERFLQD